MLLRPFSLAFGAVVRARRAVYERGWAQAYSASIPAISIGNLTVGGTGKTPFTRWLTDRLIARGQRPAILHGGYALDEPLLHRTWQPAVQVYAGRDRIASAQAAAQDGATVLVLDDGRQHLRLARDLDIVLIAADGWNEPHRLLPAGAWREPLCTLRPTDAIVITRKAASHEHAEQVARAVHEQSGIEPLAIASFELLEPTEEGKSGRAGETPDGVVVACGIADPETFVRQLEAAGVQVRSLMAFPDHHTYTTSDLRRIQEQAGGQAVVITEKDAVKIRAVDPAFGARVVRQRVTIEMGEASLWSRIERVLQ